MNWADRHPVLSTLAIAVSIIPFVLLVVALAICDELANLWRRE